MGQNENTDAMLQELFARLAVNEGKAELIVQACFRFMVLSWAVDKMPSNEVKYLKEELEKCSKANSLTEFVALMEAAKKQYKLVCHKFRYPDLVDFASFFPKKTKSIEVEKVIDDPEKPGQTKIVRAKEKVQTTDLREFCQIMPDAMGHTGYSIMHYLFQTRTEAIAHGNNAALGLAQSARKIFHTDGGNKRIALLNYCAFFTHIEVLKISTDPDGGDRTPVMIEFTEGGIEFWLKVRAMARMLYAPFARRCVEIRRSIEDIETRGGSGPSGSGLIGISAVLLTSALLTFGGASHAKAENAWNGIELTSAYNSEINTSWFEEASWASIQRSSGKGEWLQNDTNFEFVTIMTEPMGSKEIKSQFDVQFVHVDLPTYDMEGSGLDATASIIGGAAIFTAAYRREAKWTVSYANNWTSMVANYPSGEFDDNLTMVLADPPLSDESSRLGGTLPLIQMFSRATDDLSLNNHNATYETVAKAAYASPNWTTMDSTYIADGLSSPTDRLGETVPLLMAAFSN